MKYVIHDITNTERYDRVFRFYIKHVIAARQKMSLQASLIV